MIREKIKNHFIIILCCIITIGSIGILDSQKLIKFEHLTKADGLSQNDINSIFQDKEGFLWFGTDDGLNKYDRYEFTVFNPKNNNPKSINSNLV